MVLTNVISVADNAKSGLDTIRRLNGLSRMFMGASITSIALASMSIAPSHAQTINNGDNATVTPAANATVTAAAGVTSTVATGDLILVDNGAADVTINNAGTLVATSDVRDAVTIDIDNGELRTIINNASTGILRGTNGVVVLEGDDAVLTNAGLISGTGTQTDGVVYFDNDGERNRLNNSGIIESLANGTAIGIDMSTGNAPSTHVINNTGTIRALSASDSTADGINIDGSGGSTGIALPGTFSGSITNSGTISTASTNSSAAGVRIENDAIFAGTLVNQQGGLISGGSSGIRVGGDPSLTHTGTFTNSGRIVGGDRTFRIDGNGVNITNNATGRIEGGNAGIYYDDPVTSGQTTNSGFIGGSDRAFRVDGSGVTLNNLAGGMIDGNTSGVFLDSTGSNFTVTNAGTFRSADRAFRVAGANATLDNQVGGVIDGDGEGVYLDEGSSNVTITNAGTITSLDRAVSIFGTGHSLTNSGLIQGTFNQAGGAVEVDNTATNITITNAATGVIETATGFAGTGLSVRVGEVAGAPVRFTLNNAGRITGRGDGKAGLSIDADNDDVTGLPIPGATLTANSVLNNTGTISSDLSNAVDVGDVVVLANIVNSGTFTGDRGFNSESGGVLMNSGTITGTGVTTGGEAIRFTGNANATATLSSTSTTQALASMTSNGDAVAFEGIGTNTLNISAGAVVIGNIEGSELGVSDTLNLSGMGAGGTLQVQDFDMLNVSGGSWTLGAMTTGFLGATNVTAGSLINNGVTGGAVSVSSGASFAGTGTIGGIVTIANGATLGVGDNGVGTLTTGGLVLNSGSIVNFDLGAPNMTGTSDLIVVNGALTLDGTANINNVGQFGQGVYRLINYTGLLTDNGLEIGTLPAGFTAAQTEVQTSTLGQVNLVVSAVGGGIPDTQFWDGSGIVANGMVDGGAGTWNVTTPNWTNAAGDRNDPWNSKFAVFSGVGGVVTVADQIQFTGMQFSGNGYNITFGAGDLIANAASTDIIVDAGVSATIGEAIIGTGGIEKLGSGTLILSGINNYAGATTVSAGALVVNRIVPGTTTVASGATLAGNNTLGGLVTVADGGIIAAGADIGANNIATLRFAAGLNLSSGSILNFDLGAPNVMGASDLLVVDQGLTLDGTLNVNNAGQFGTGVYRLIDYTGTLTDNGLLVGMLPTGFTSAQTQVQTSMAGQVNLVVSMAGGVIPDIQFWDGADIVADGVIDGGNGSWNTVTTNWTNAAGDQNNAWNNRFAVFQGPAGTVTVDGAIAFTGLQFASTGYNIAAGTGALSTTATPANIRVDPGLTATISAPISGSGGIDKLDSGNLILAGVNTYTGNTAVSGGTLTLTGTIAGTTSIASGATLAGTGIATGAVTVANGGILAAGNGGVGTLTTGALNLSSGSILNYDLGAPNVMGGSDLIVVNGALTLDGTVNVNNVGQFGTGVYRLINYTGALTDNGLLVGTLPTGFTTGQTSVQTSTMGQVNLVVASSIPDVQFWDGAGTTANSVIDGGSGSWNTTTTNWTNAAGTQNNAWNSRFAVFQGTAGTVTVNGPISFTGMQFITDGYTIASGTGSLSTTSSPANIRVDSGRTATISAPISGAGGINKLDSGTLILNGNHTYTGATTVSGGILVVNDSLASAVTVAGNSILGGRGRVGGLTVNSVLSPGNSIGTLSVAGNASFAAGSTYIVETLPTGASDLLAATGNVTIGGGTVQVIAGGANYNSSTNYTIVTAGGTRTGTFTGVTSNLAFLTPTLGYTGNSVTLNLRRNDIAFTAIAQTPNQIAVAGAVQAMGTGVLVDSILNQSADTARAAFDQLSGEIHPSVRTVMAEDVRLPRNAVLDRLTTITAGNAIWGSAWGNRADSDGNLNSAKVSRDNYGAILGADIGLGETATFGIAGSYTDTDVDLQERSFVGGPNLGSGSVESFHVLGYIGAQIGGFGVRAGAGYAWTNVETARSVAFTSFSDNLVASYDGSMVHGFGEIGYKFDVGQGFVEPFVGGNIMTVKTDAFAEAGGLAKLTATRESENSTASNAGLRFGTSDSEVFSVNGRIGWQHNYGNLTPDTTFNFAGGQAFTVRGAPQSRDAGFAQIEAQYRLSENSAIGVSYDGVLGDASQDHALMARVVIGF